MNTFQTSAYRKTDTFIYSCSLCGDEALFCCPRCGRPLCSHHAVSVDMRCVACEADYEGSKAAPWVALGLGIAEVALYVGVFRTYGSDRAFVLPGSELGFLYTVGIAMLIVVSTVFGVWRFLEGRARARFLRQGNQEFVLGALEINPDAGEQAGSRSVQVGRPPATDASRGVPSLPIYQKTFGH